MCKTKEVMVFRFYYKREVEPNPMIQHWNPKTQDWEFVHCQLNTVPDSFWFNQLGDFVRDDFILERALEVIIWSGYAIISVLGPMKMWGQSNEISYQIIAQKVEG